MSYHVVACPIKNDGRGWGCFWLRSKAQFEASATAVGVHLPFGSKPCQGAGNGPVIHPERPSQRGDLAPDEWLVPADGMTFDVGDDAYAGWQRRVAVVGFEALVWHRGEGFNYLYLRSILGMFYDVFLRYVRGFEKVVTVM